MEKKTATLPHFLFFEASSSLPILLSSLKRSQCSLDIPTDVNFLGAFPVEGGLHRNVQEQGMSTYVTVDKFSKLFYHLLGIAKLRKKSSF